MTTHPQIFKVRPGASFNSSKSYAAACEPVDVDELMASHQRDIDAWNAKRPPEGKTGRNIEIGLLILVLFMTGPVGVLLILALGLVKHYILKYTDKKVLAWGLRSQRRKLVKSLERQGFTVLQKV